MENYHITKKGNAWALQKDGNTKPSKTAPTKREIIAKAHAYMKDKEGSVKIHGENGQIQEERTFQRGDDPSKSPG